MKLTLSAAALLAGSLLAGPLVAQERRELPELLDEPENLELLTDPEAVMAWVGLPRAVTLGETVRVELTIENGRETRPFRLTQIDIADAFLEGFEVSSISPEPKRRDHSQGMLSLDLPLDVAPGATQAIVLTLRAKQAGVFIGDVDFNEDRRFLTRVAQTRVRARQP